MLCCKSCSTLQLAPLVCPWGNSAESCRLAGSSCRSNPALWAAAAWSWRYEVGGTYLLLSCSSANATALRLYLVPLTAVLISVVFVLSIFCSDCNLKLIVDLSFLLTSKSGPTSGSGLGLKVRTPLATTSHGSSMPLVVQWS